ncbi:pilus assembly protein CpaC [Marinobacter daqiaonensis]|uniref:Pilus assembly protein CpaC n=2 Tax=Marinobacter daqiaonensis TaxID=650891 RepID=A0A1I6JGG6_9GAMM|nr:pilus assembly protein CpaC [Marinobacter daqiaonensis]
MQKAGINTLTGFAALLFSLCWPAMVTAQSSDRISYPNPDPTSPVSVEVPLNKSRLMGFPNAVKIVSVGNPDIADVVVVRSRQIYVLGKTLGSTNVLLWDKDENLQGTLNVKVTHDLENLKANLHALLPGERIGVRSANETLVLTGEVTSAARADAAMRVASSFAGAGREQGQSPILNLMQIGGAQQVMLDVKVAEVSRSLVKRLDIQFDVLNIAGSSVKLGAVNGGASFPDAVFDDSVLEGGRLPVFGGQTPIGPVVDEFAPNMRSIEDTGIFASFAGSDYLVNAVLDAAKREGVAKILAEPNLTTLTGEEARFLAGGEFPIPVPQGDGQVTVEQQEFGVSLGFLPVVLDSGIINLRVDVAVSELTNNNALRVGVGQEGQVANQFFIPALVKRSASSTLELGNGQTIAIAGMLNETLRENASKFPGLGDIPIIGALFRSQEFIKEQTELVIFVTARLAKPVAPEDIRLPTGSFVAPSDVEFYLLGRLQGRPHKPERSDSGTIDPLRNRLQGGTEGVFGHDL